MGQQSKPSSFAVRTFQVCPRPAFPLDSLAALTDSASDPALGQDLLAQTLPVTYGTTETLSAFHRQPQSLP